MSFAAAVPRDYCDCLLLAAVVVVAAVEEPVDNPADHSSRDYDDDVMEEADVQVDNRSHHYNSVDLDDDQAAADYYTGRTVDVPMIARQRPLAMDHNIVLRLVLMVTVDTAVDYYRCF
jgi:hypothetical protein